MKAPKTLDNHCEEEPDAGERNTSSPQTERVPEQAPSTAHLRGTAPHLGI